MADAATFKPTITIGTPLYAGNKQNLQLQIATNCTVRIVMPLGNAANALMTVDEFNNAEVSLRPLSKPEGKGDWIEGGDLPQELEGAPEQRGVGRNNDVGYIPIPVTLIDEEPKSVFVFNIWLRNFLVQKDEGSVTIELQTETAPRNWTRSDTKTAGKMVLEPRITSFTANRYNVKSGGGVELKWTIEPAGNFEMKVPGARPLVTGEQKGDGKWPGNVRTGRQDFILEAWAGKERPAYPESRRLRIDINSQTKFDGYELASPDWDGDPRVLGLYAHRRRGRLYALLRFPDSPYASLWYTEHGFTPAPDEWREATRKTDGKKALIPVAAARRPGAIFNDKLFLIGGDCCNPNSPGSGLGYCDLNEDTGLDWQEVGKKEAWSWPEGMAERMGHAVVVVPDENGKEIGLWVMGGWRQDGGVCDDIWEFDGTTHSPWKKVEGLPLPRCLFGATATREAVWTVGGFGSPGGAPNDAVVRRCEIGAKSWDVSGLPEVPEIDANYQYSASVLFSREGDADKPYGIATFWKGNAPDRKYFYFEKTTSWTNPRYFREEGPEVLVQRRNWYHMQSAVFRDAVFFRTLTADESRAGNTITYLVFEAV
jgi:hypothetical protein